MICRAMDSGPVARLTVGAAKERLECQGELFVTMLERGSLSVELYRPVGRDLQQPHNRDEIYVVVSGSGVFECAGERRPFEPGEVLFVPAWVDHRFVEFSDDFATWVFFYGPIGGEKP
jgi:mannose-6-phosphate isomerase-like protein (cupin superfamily)